MTAETILSTRGIGWIGLGIGLALIAVGVVLKRWDERAES